jgi:hypothetical protein
VVVVGVVVSEKIPRGKGIRPGRVKVVCGLVIEKLRVDVGVWRIERAEMMWWVGRRIVDATSAPRLVRKANLRLVRAPVCRHRGGSSVVSYRGCGAGWSGLVIFGR